MSANFYHQCHSGIGRAVEIRTHGGRIHRGIIERVSRNRVYLRPMSRPGNYGGFGYGYYGGWGGFGVGFGFGVAIGAIVALAFIPFFF